MVGLNRRGGGGAVAPRNARCSGIRGGEGSRLDRVSHVVLHSGGVDFGEEGTIERVIRHDLAGDVHRRKASRHREGVLPKRGKRTGYSQCHD